MSERLQRNELTRQNTEGFCRNELITPNQVLTPVENLLIGSSTYYNGGILNSKEFMRRLQSGEGLSEDIFLPVALINNESNIETVQSARRQRDYLEGLFPCFSPVSQVGLANENLLPIIKLPEIDPESGFAIPHWVVMLKDMSSKALIPTGDKLRRLTVARGLSEHLKLVPDAEGVLVLSLHL